jgi:hypothetical protein
MRKSQHSAVLILILIVLASVAAIARTAPGKGSTATYVPPSEPGLIYTIIDFNRADGRTQNTPVSVSWGDVHRNFVVSSPYAANPCSTSTPSGFVFRLRNNQGDSTPLTITTSGTIVRGPFQGDVPMELLHACYRLVK